MKRILIVFSILIIPIFVFLFVGKAPISDDITWGVTFSSNYAIDLGLDWKEAYLEILDDLSPRRIRIATQWNDLEPEKRIYHFEDLDWQIEEAEMRQIDFILTVGMKTPRWPECHIPYWANDLNKGEQQEEILTFLETVILRYKDHPNLIAWQIENEPFLDFGVCPWYDKEFFLKEIDLANSIDPDTPKLVTESGELSLWFLGAEIGDMVGTTMYRQTWWHKAGGFYAKYPIPAIHYYRKALIIRKIFDKDVIVVELQGEPWGPVPTFILDLKEQEKSMNPEIFDKNIDYAIRSGFDEFYLWGVEWWYWMKTVNNQPEIWQQAKKLLR